MIREKVRFLGCGFNKGKYASHLFIVLSMDLTLAYTN